METVLHFENGNKLLPYSQRSWNSLAYAACGADLCDDKGRDNGARFTRDEDAATCPECRAILDRQEGA